jgi:glycosyltransferase involved in cell wall biosynthesis
MRALQLTAYSMNSGIHGGIIRSQEIRNLFEQAGCIVETLNIDPINIETNGFDSSLPLIDDVKCLNMKLDNLNNVTNLDYIILEQPWLAKVALHLLAINPNSKLIYSSHNFESSLKAKILKNYDSNQVREVTNLIDSVELNLVNLSDLLIYCAENDLAKYLKLCGKKARNVLYFPNSTRLNRFKSLNSSSMINTKSRYIAVVGSNYPPTIDGFNELMQGFETWLLPGTSIYVIGSLSKGLIRKFPARNETYFSGGIKYFNQVSDSELYNLLVSAAGILLPVKYGGGTNLKTAEALYFNCPIIASPESIRGFERELGKQRITIVRDNFETRDAITKALSQNKNGQKISENLEFTWDYWVNRNLGQLKNWIQHD